LCSRRRRGVGIACHCQFAQAQNPTEAALHWTHRDNNRSGHAGSLLERKSRLSFLAGIAIAPDRQIRIEVHPDGEALEHGLYSYGALRDLSKRSDQSSHEKDRSRLGHPNVRGADYFQ
jgi:hypothetical protein